MIQTNISCDISECPDPAHTKTEYTLEGAPRDSITLCERHNQYWHESVETSVESGAVVVHSQRTGLIDPVVKLSDGGTQTIDVPDDVKEALAKLQLSDVFAMVHAGRVGGTYFMYLDCTDDLRRGPHGMRDLSINIPVTVGKKIEGPHWDKMVCDVEVYVEGAGGCQKFPIAAPLSVRKRLKTLGFYNPSAKNAPIPHNPGERHIYLEYQDHRQIDGALHQVTVVTSAERGDKVTPMQWDAAITRMIRMSTP